jgi:hypothetical protein
MNYLGFYWTLPVLWAGFRELPTDPDEAAKVSKTIRYQVERVRRWVKDEKGHLLSEYVFMDKQPDRGTDVIESDIKRVLAKATKLNAQVVLVDFSIAYGWRPHSHLFASIGDQNQSVTLPPEPALIDAKWWDPIEHFRTWRQTDVAYQMTKADLKATALSTISGLKAEGATYEAIAAHLNEIGLKTVNGLAWKAENLRKFMAQR